MKTWKQLLIRHGWLLPEREVNVFDVASETKENMTFLKKSLTKVNVNYWYDELTKTLTLPSLPISEEKWTEAIDYLNRGRGEGLWFHPETDQPVVEELDTYISGIVRQLNRLGFSTIGSCDGHGRTHAHVLLARGSNLDVLGDLINAIAGKEVRIGKRQPNITFHTSRNDLLDIAEKLSIIEASWLVNGSEYIKEMLFRNSLEQLLSIPGESSHEEKVRNYVIEKISPYIDHLTVDRTGNILAEKTYRSGNGPTILLNAHLDTVLEIEEGRKIIKEGNIWSSSKGILGADDRAGVAILLHLAEFLLKSTFSGKVKFIFTVEEEIGLVGARKVDNYFLWGVDAAIVIDRRGEGDIVTSCGGYLPFCHKAYGAFFEEVAAIEGLKGWETTAGGSSDTRVWAEHGIQSVNLSAGYMNEHRSEEYVNVKACYQTAKLVEGVFKNAMLLRRTLQEIRREKHSQQLLKRA